MGRKLKPGGLPNQVESGPWSTIVKAVQGNFDHIQSVIRAFVEGHNTLADDVEDLQAFTEQGLEDTTGAEHAHDGSADGGGTVDHGGLAGLADDDHTQYARLSAQNTFTDVQTVSGGTTAKDRLNLGADTNLYRSAADTLKTDDTFNIGNSGGLQVSGTKVVGVQGAAVADATDAATVITQLNALLARARAHGLIVT